MVGFLGCAAGALAGFLGAKVINYGIMCYQNQPQREPLRGCIDPVDPSCCDIIPWACEMPVSQATPANAAPMSCCKEIQGVFSRYLKQIGYSLTTIGGAVLGASYATADDSQDTPSFQVVYACCLTMFAGIIAVAQANIRSSCGNEEERKPIGRAVQHYGTDSPALCPEPSSPQEEL